MRTQHASHSLHLPFILSFTSPSDNLFKMAAIASEYLADVLEPEKFAAAIFGVTLAFTVLSTNTVGLRAWIRFKKGQFGNDDYLMCTALVVNLIHNSMVMHGTFVGIGSPDSKLNPELDAEGRKVDRLAQPRSAAKRTC